jgi:Raf kinase inhibitor-like YbhB/YbcL family protein
VLKAALIAATIGALALPAGAAREQMTLTVKGAHENALAPAAMVFCTPAPSGHVRFGTNQSPSLRWTAPPPGTRSLALMMFDDDVPVDVKDVNQEGRHIEASAPRRRFYHWMVADLPAGLRSIAAGAGGAGVVPRGRSAEPGRARAGINDYTGFFANDAAMAGTYRGYDGPCPPWNDERIHRYVIRILALDVPRLPLSDDFTGAQFEDAARGHVLASGSTTVTYTTKQPAL